MKNFYKTLIIFFLFLSPLHIYSQTDSVSTDLPYIDGKIVYEKVVTVNGIKKDIIYATAKKWIVDSFIDKNTFNQTSIIKTEDKEVGQIIGKGYKRSIFFEDNPTQQQKMMGTLFNLFFFVQIDCKDEKFRIRFYELKRDLIFVNQVQSLEEYDTIMANHKKQKTRVDWITWKRQINKYFIQLPTELTNKVLEASNDAF